jgi:hypothetical protein
MLAGDASTVRAVGDADRRPTTSSSLGRTKEDGEVKRTEEEEADDEDNEDDEADADADADEKADKGEEEEDEDGAKPELRDGSCDAIALSADANNTVGDAAAAVESGCDETRGGGETIECMSEVSRAA